MCQPVQYTYLGCGQLIAAVHLWVPESCVKALASGRACWIAPNIPLGDIVRKTWEGEDPGPCTGCAVKRPAAKQDGDESR